MRSEITYRVPAGRYCNHTNNPKELCRFCVKHKQTYVCVLHNMPLQSDIQVYKTESCYRQTSKLIEDTEEMKIDYKKLVRTIFKSYDKAYHSFVKQGVPTDIARDLARDVVMKENEDENM